MLIVDLKIFMLSFSFCYCITLAYNNNNNQRYQQHKQHEDSIDWRQRFLTNNNKQLQQQKTTTTTTIVPVTSANDIYLKNFKIRHHSRYPNLDRFESKIKYFKAPVTKQNNDNNKIRHDGAGGGHFSKTSPINYDDGDDGGDVLSDDNGRSKTQRHPSIYYATSKVRHDGRNLRNTYRTLQATTTTTTTTTTTVPSVDDDLFDDEDEDNDNEYDDDWDDDFDDYYDDDPFTNDDNDDEWQAEEATETSQQQQQPISSFTKFKWDNYGSRARVEESRRQYFKANNPQNDTLAVLAHYMKVNQQGQCRRPIPKVIPVQLLHPDSTKSYTPHCTILHRCAEDTGCCSNYETRCGPKKQVPVHLYFYAKTLGTGETKVERLTFYNHTECACLEKSKLSSTPPTSVKMVEENDHENENSGNSLDDYSSSIVTYRSGLQSDNLIRCRCPEEFTPKYRYNSPCSCDCEEHNQDCIRMKKGKEYFSLTDRKCIMENQCGVPVCEYGVYLRQTGRCQRKQEKIESQN